MELDPGAAPKLHLQIHGAAGGGGLLHIILRQNAQIAGLEQFPEGYAFQVQ